MQRRISNLCYDRKFRSDAVMQKRPTKLMEMTGIKLKLAPSRGSEGGFEHKRAKLMEHVFIPR